MQIFLDKLKKPRNTNPRYGKHSKKLSWNWFTVIPRLTRFPIARICITRFFELVQKNLHSTILYYKISSLCKFYLQFFLLYIDLHSANFALLGFWAATPTAALTEGWLYWVFLFNTDLFCSIFTYFFTIELYMICLIKVNISKTH